MDFDVDQLLADVHAGFTVLILGSGFSYPAKNIDRNHLPTGGGLSKLLHERLEYKKEYPLDTISREYVEKFGQIGLISLLTQELTAVETTPSQKAILSLPWKRTYTTNYDNVVEMATAEAVKTVQSVNGASQTLADLEATKSAVIHINGRLDGISLANLDATLRLTRTSYLTEAFIASPWFGQLRRDVSVASAVLIIGYSVADIDIARILYADPTLRSRTYFVDTVDIDPVMQRELELFGQVLPIGVDDLATKISEYVPAKKHTRPLTSFEEFAVTPAANAPTGDDILSLLLLGKYDTKLQASANAAQTIYSIERPHVTDITKRIKSGQKYFLVHSDLGNGKTISTHQLAVELRNNKFRPLLLTDYTDQLDLDIETLTTANDVVIIVEDIFRHAAIVTKLVTMLPQFPIVVTTRSAIYELRTNRVDDILASDYVSYDINRLSSGEIEELIDLFDENGLWANFAVSSEQEKRHLASWVCHSEIRNILIKLFEAPHIKERIVSAFHKELDTDTLLIITCALLLDVAGMDTDLYLLNQLTGVDVFKKRDKLQNVFALEFVDAKYGKIRVKSSVFGEFALQNVISPEFVLKTLIQIARLCEREKQGKSALSRLFADLQKEVIRFSFVDRIFARKKAGDIYKQLYDNIKTLPSMARNPQFWLQYAIARLEDENYQASYIHFRTAYSHARPIKNYDTFQIDNHYARYLLASRTSDPGYHDDYVSFIEAHKLLIKQARKERGAYYPFKVARAYLPFYRARGKDYDVDQRRIVSGAAEEILSEIALIPKTAQKYYVIDECHRELTELVSEINAAG